MNYLYFLTIGFIVAFIIFTAICIIGAVVTFIILFAIDTVVSSV